MLRDVVTRIAVLVLGLVVLAVGLRSLVTGHFVAGSPGRPLWNWLSILRSDAVKFQPWTARLLGLLLAAIGSYAVYAAVLVG
jgi:hypothetical protein